MTKDFRVWQLTGGNNGTWRQVLPGLLACDVAHGTEDMLWIGECVGLLLVSCTTDKDIAQVAMMCSLSAHMHAWCYSLQVASASLKVRFHSYSSALPQATTAAEALQCGAAEWNGTACSGISTVIPTVDGWIRMQQSSIAAQRIAVGADSPNSAVVQVFAVHSNGVLAMKRWGIPFGRIGSGKLMFCLGVQ